MQDIYHQGVFDGACFLYSIVNGYSALMKKPINQEKWDEAIKWIPFSSDYISEIGTQRTDDDFNLYKFTIHRFLREFDKPDKFVVKEHPSITTKEQLQALVTKDSVLIVNVEGGHWVVIVDYDDSHLKAVCSAQLFEKKEKYKEFDCAETQRKCNLKKQYGKLRWLYQPSAISISVNNT